jgi:hypothetical protein
MQGWERCCTGIAQTSRRELCKENQEGQKLHFVSRCKVQGEDRRNFDFSNYVQIHQDGHNELHELEEAVPETKKVQDFLTGILDRKLQIGIDIILATPIYLQDFKECQQCLSTLVSNCSIQAKNDRTVGLTT